MSDCKHNVDVELICPLQQCGSLNTQARKATTMYQQYMISHSSSHLPFLQALVELLQQNIVAARNAEQEDAAKFMEKVLVATSRHFISTQQASTTMPEKSAALGLQQAAPLLPPAAAPTPGQSLLLNAQPVPASSGGKNNNNERKTAGGLYLP